MVHVLVIPTTVHVAPKALRTRRAVVSRSSAIPLRASTEKNDDVVSIASPSAPRTVGTAAFVGTLAATSSALPAHATTELAQVASNSPLESARLFIAIATVALILFQGPKGDGVVNSLNENRVFGSASEAKSAVDYITAGLIGGFIILSGILAIQ